MRDAEERGAEDHRHGDERPRRVAGLRALERRDAVGHRLHARQRHGAGRERPQQQEERRASGSSSASCSPSSVSGMGPRSNEEDPDEPGDDQDDEHHDVEVGRSGEQAAGLLDPAQVGDGHQHDARRGRAGRSTVWSNPAAERMASDAAGHRNGHREDVVDEERRAGDQRRDRPQVLPADDVAAAAARVGEDRLAVAGRHDGQQDADDDGDRHEVLPRLRHRCGPG